MVDAPISWSETCRRLSLDRTRLRYFNISKFGYAPWIFLDPSWLCVLFHRLSHWSFRAGRRKRARFFMQLNALVTGADIMPPSDIGGGLLIPTPCGVNISGKAGRNLTALALAGIGGSVRDYDVGGGVGLPALGNDVTAGFFAGIQGSIRLGDGCDIGPGCGAVINLPAGSRMVVAVEPEIGAPAAVPEHRIVPGPVCRHASWREIRAAFAADVTRFVAEQNRYAEPGQAKASRVGAGLSNSLMALYVYRLSHWLFRNDRRTSAHLLCLLNFLLHKVMIPPASCLDGGVLMPHLGGVLFVGQAGRNLTLYASTLCAPFSWERSYSPASGPRLGDDVLVGGQSAAMGAIEIGARVQLAPKANAHEDVAEDIQLWSRTSRGTANPKRVSAQKTMRAAPVPPPKRLPPATWRETRGRIARDRERLTALRNQEPQPISWLLLIPARLCVRLHRLSHFFHAAGRRRAARWCWLVNYYLTGADIAPQSEIGGGFLIPYPAGIAICCRAGGDLTVLASSGIGAGLTRDSGMRPLDETPQLGEGVIVSHHCGVYGAVSIGSGVRIQPGCTVTKDVPEGVTLVARPVKSIRRRRYSVTREVSRVFQK